MSRRTCWHALALSSVICLAACADEPNHPVDAPAVRPRDLLSAAVFPESSFGMAVESVTEGPPARVVTTGAEFIFNQDDTIECRQRLVQARPLAYLCLPAGSLAKPRLRHQSPGAAIFAAGESVVRINGDSLLMVAPAVAGDIAAMLAFVPDYHAEFAGNFNFFDPNGGVSFFEHGQCGGARWDALADPVRIVWPWRAGDVFWMAASPPKPFDWNASLRERIVVHGSSEDRYMYPSDLDLLRFKSLGNILYLHNEMMWEHWNLNLVPRDRENYLRVMHSAHQLGLKTMVYASPRYFVKGTPAEAQAHPDPHHGPGWQTGSNEPLYLAQARRIVHELETDGLYFDGIYQSRSSLAASYHLSRACRDLVGPEGPLHYHATTDALGDGHLGVYCPTLEAYYNGVWKGEGEWDRMELPYTRYVLSTYNLSNALAYQALDLRANYVFDFAFGEKVDFWLCHANARFYFWSAYAPTGRLELFRRYYLPRLTEGLPAQLEPVLAQPTGAFEQFRRSIQRSLQRAGQHVERGAKEPRP
jgi:hypothetical protein